MATTKKSAAKTAASKAKPKAAVTKTITTREGDTKEVASTRLATPSEEAANKPKEVVQRGDKTPDAQPTPREARAAADAMFEKADEAGKAEIISETSLRRAALGY